VLHSNLHRDLALSLQTKQHVQKQRALNPLKKICQSFVESFFFPKPSPTLPSQFFHTNHFSVFTVLPTHVKQLRQTSRFGKTLFPKNF